MSALHLPGFTAEDALHAGHGHYRSGARHATHSEVTPQAIDIGCWVRSATRTFSRCTSIGFDSGTCARLAVDLASDVCDF